MENITKQEIKSLNKFIKSMKNIISEQQLQSYTDYLYKL